MSIKITDYLRSRNFNHILLQKINDEALRDVINTFNNHNERKVVVEWDMSAKHQKISLNIKMEDGGDISGEVEEFACDFGELGEVLDDWFGVYTDNDDIHDTYISVLLNM